MHTTTIPKTLRTHTISSPSKRSTSTNPHAPSSPTNHPLSPYKANPARRSQSQQRSSKHHLFDKARKTDPTQTYLRVNSNTIPALPRRIKSYDDVPTEIRTQSSHQKLTSLVIKHQAKQTIKGSQVSVPDPLSVLMQDFGASESLSSIRESSFEVLDRAQDDNLMSLLTWNQ